MSGTILENLVVISEDNYGHKLCRCEKRYLENIEIVPYIVILMSNGNIVHCDSLLLPLSETCAIRTFEENYGRRKKK